MPVIHSCLDDRGGFPATHPEHGPGLVAWFKGGDPHAGKGGRLRAIIITVERSSSSPLRMTEISEDEMAALMPNEYGQAGA